MSLVRSRAGKIISNGSDCFLVSLILRTKLSNIPSSAVQDRRKPSGVASETRRLSTSGSASREKENSGEGRKEEQHLAARAMLFPVGYQNAVMPQLSETEVS